MNKETTDIIYESDFTDDGRSNAQFRPSCLPAINTRNVVEPSSQLMNTPRDTIINYYSLLREATNVKGIGCGTTGTMANSYPIAYQFLSEDLRKKMDIETYMESFGSVSHINLIKLIRINNDMNYYVELEYIDPPGSFSYYSGMIDLIKENGSYKINDIFLEVEEFFCAPYHGWIHNAELKVEAMYGNWCDLIEIKYPTIETPDRKNIQVKGKDHHLYLFTFAKLTNGTDVELGQYKMSDSGKWEPFYIDPYKCLSPNLD